jgi:hypothetical protein
MSEDIIVVARNKSKPVEANKFHIGNGDDGKHYWLTPPDLYKKLNMEFNFTFDPCPYPKPEEFDGLTCEWGDSSYVNPPFGSIIHQGKKKGPTAWARKAVAESQKGKMVVLVYPIDKWVLMLIQAGAEVRNLGDVRWLATEDGSQGKGTGRHIACFVLDGKKERQTEIERLRAENERLREALKCLVDEQNGPPLLQREHYWREAMDMAGAALNLSRHK